MADGDVNTRVTLSDLLAKQTNEEVGSEAAILEVSNEAAILDVGHYNHAATDGLVSEKTAALPTVEVTVRTASSQPG